MQTEFQLTPKQAEYIRNANHRWNVACGAVRSGKSFCQISYCIPARLMERKGLRGLRVILGATRANIERNILQPMRDIYGDGIATGINSQNIARIMGEKVYCIGADNVRQVAKIRGSEIAYVAIDEATDINYEVFEMLKSRLSLPWSCCDATTNPASPNHWFKEFLDSADRGVDIYCQNYTIYDNPFLPKEFVESLCHEYAGTVYYKRYILGEWARAEGLIYPMITEDNYYDDDTRPVALYSTGYRTIACDYGTTNPCVFLDIWDDGSTLWVDDEWRWDSQSDQAKRSTAPYRTDAQYADAMGQFMGSDPARQCMVIVDPSAKSFITELRQRGFYVKEGDNDVLDGIRKTSSLFAKRKIRVHRRCTGLIDELLAYAWDDKASLVGEEKPVKAQDHGPDALRYRVNDLPEWRITI